MNEQQTMTSYVIANGVSRAEADEIRRLHGDCVVSRNRDGTYRITRRR